MTDQQKQRLIGVHPILIDRVSRVLAAMEALGFPMMPTDGLRTVEQQRALYAQGRTVPGAIVTHADGTITTSNHQMKGDGMGHAVDCCFVVDGKPSWDARLPWRCYGEVAKAVGLRWGGDWEHLHDLPHVELA